MHVDFRDQIVSNRILRREIEKEGERERKGAGKECFDDVDLAWCVTFRSSEKTGTRAFSPKVETYWTIGYRL